jgi:AraC-like DNA-binding protein
VRWGNYAEHASKFLGDVVINRAITTTVNTSSVHPRDRFDYWHEMACQAMVPFECRPRDRSAFEGEVRSVPFGNASLTLSGNNGVTTWRTAKQVAQSKDTVFICAQTAGATRINQNGRDAFLQCGDLTLVDNAVPSEFVSTVGSKKLVVEVDRKECEARLGRVTQWTAQRIDGSGGAGALVSNFIQLLPAQIPLLSEAAQSQIAHQLIDLVAVALAEGDGTASARSSARLISLLRLKSVVDANLTNAHVTCEELAAAAGISVRYANQLLDAEQTSLQRLLFSRRIARCQEALADPSQTHRQISDIAYSWGFADVSHFGRLFKNATGMTPRSYRKHAFDTLHCVKGHHLRSI